MDGLVVRPEEGAGERLITLIAVAQTPIPVVLFPISRMRRKELERS